jgi:hypothetical protein
MRETIKRVISGSQQLDDSFIHEFIRMNPGYYEGYELAGDYFLKKNKPAIAQGYYKLALGKEIPRMNEKRKIIHKLCSCTNN